MNSANGGYACGRIAPFVDAETVEVTLLLPPPLETPLRVEPAGDGVRVFDGEALVAEGRPAELTLDVPDAPDFVEASRVSAAQAVDANHPFPGCFTCGPAREEGDGLRLRPGAAGGGLVVAPYRPADTAPELVWAALDCPGAYAVDPGFARGVSVLGRLTGRILGAVGVSGDNPAVIRAAAISPRRPTPM